MAPASGEPAQTPALTAVFFLHLSATAGAMIEAWLDSGHRISSVVVYGRKAPRFWSAPIRWLALQWLVMRHLRRHRIPVIDPKPPLDWQKLTERLAEDRPDVAITYGFMRLIPHSVREIFPRGALNFHPALLPHYRGPQPFHWLAFDNTWDRFGGVTLHEMTGRFDEGPIIAQVAMADIPAITDPGGFVADAVACMTRHVVPRYCTGEIPARPQPQGLYRYAGIDIPKPVVQSHWTRKHLQHICAVFLKRPGVCIDVAGRKIRLLKEAKVLGQPYGRPSTANWRSVEFDLADRRVIYRRHTPFNKFFAGFAAVPRRFRRPTQKLPIRLGPFGSDPARQTDLENSTDSS